MAKPFEPIPMPYAKLNEDLKLDNVLEKESLGRPNATSKKAKKKDKRKKDKEQEQKMYGYYRIKIMSGNFIVSYISGLYYPKILMMPLTIPNGLHSIPIRFLGKVT